MVAVPAVELEGLVRAYGERPVLRGVSVTVPAGATLAVLGRNGAGKSTLLRILATLLRPHGGVVRLLGHELPAEGWAVRGRIGFLAHDPLLYRELSARENLRLHARLHRAPPERVDALLERVGMASRGNEPVRTLSRGMVQRVAICRTVLHAPDLLLLDEPEANLDPGAAALVEPLIGPASGATRVVTSHDPVAAVAGADLVLGLSGGRGALLAPAGEVEPAAVEALYA
jgi:heme exporter protein A